MRSKRSSLGRKRRDLTPLLILLSLSPYIVGFTSDSTSSYVETMIGAGTGQYVYYDCSGAHTRQFSDAGISVTKKFEGPYRLGFIAGGLKAGDNGTPYFFPDLALDWETVSLGTTGFRIGKKRSFYFEGRWLDQPPLLSGKGMLRTGFGGTFYNDRSMYWLGANVLPYHKLGFAGQLDLPLRENTFIFLNSRFGSEAGLQEFGVSIGVRFISY